ncbi:twin transmembrane helix small protein [Cucumibacter marinus]|jgi:preprotein translocase subunit SecG|uniref:twin transmembrane helix small protein n=1 Tax=Cucumibacter marinus TaxID=1121252 RepID=UPI000407CC42|nr:twin transmembrane helix small protein [Cucumibacter marinus]
MVINILIMIALAVVVLILGAGLWNMFRGGDGNLSQKLMRARVIAQFVAVVLLMLALFVFSPGGGS